MRRDLLVDPLPRQNQSGHVGRPSSGGHGGWPSSGGHGGWPSSGGHVGWPSSGGHVGRPSSSSEMTLVREGIPFHCIFSLFLMCLFFQRA